MDIKKIIKEHHQAMINKGFYECPECLGTAREIKSEDYQCLICQSFKDRDFNECIECIPLSCSHCDGEGINPKKIIGELLMLIVSELSEALEAHRNDRFAFRTLPNFDIDSLMKTHETTDIMYLFEGHVKDTFEDEIADVFLRLFDLCGYLEIDIEKHITAKMAYNKSRPHKHGKEY